MKHGKNPTVAQRKLIKSWHLNPGNWLVCKDTPVEMVIQHRISDKIRKISKGKEE